MKNLYLSVGLGVLMFGCAAEPTEQIQQAEAAITEAARTDAGDWAPEAYKKAEEKMAEAKRLLADREYAEAAPVLEEAVRLAAEATNQAARAKQEAEAEKKRAEVAARQQAEAEAEEAARRSSHTVVKGECLWYIAGYDDVYGDPHQWPRIYNANKDKIRNPDLIYPDQVLQIPR